MHIKKECHKIPCMSAAHDLHVKSEIKMNLFRFLHKMHVFFGCERLDININVFQTKNIFIHRTLTLRQGLRLFQTSFSKVLYVWHKLGYRPT